MDEFIALRRKDWKNRIDKKIRESSSINGALHCFLEEYLFYSKDEKELSKRLKKISDAAGIIVKRFNERRTFQPSKPR